MPLRPEHEEIYQALPKLTSPELLAVLKMATAVQLPAEVLVRIYRASNPSHENAKAALDRLLAENAKFNYMKALRWLALQRANGNEGDAEDRYQDAIVVILKTLGTERGAFAEQSWVSFCKQRFEDAWRERFGREGARLDPDTVSIDGEESEDDGSQASGVVVDADHRIPWHGRFTPDRLKWLEKFVHRRLAACGDETMRLICMDQWFEDPPSPISGTAKHGAAPLTKRFGLSRDQVNRKLRNARILLRVELENQNECDIDTDWLRPRR